MEGYVSPIKFESFPISAFDMQGSFSNIPYAFFYENTNSGDNFMPSNLLKASLRESLRKFPILTGHIRMKAIGRIAIDVDAENLNLPEFLESTSDSIHFSDIKAAGFSWDKWPDNVMTVGPVATAAADGEIKLLNIHTIRLKENSGLVLFLNIPHYVVDGYGFFAFANHWASTMRRMHRVPEKGQLNGFDSMEESDFSFDRGIIQNYLPKERTPLDEVTHSIYAIRNMFVDWIAWLSPTTLGGLLSKTVGMARGEAHLFHASREALEKLHKDVFPHLPTGIRISDNDLLVALISKTYVQSQVQPKPRRWSPFGSAEPETHCTVRVPCDVRPRLGVKERFTGNLLVGMFVRDRLDDLARPTTAETLAAAAVEVRKVVNSVKPPLVAEYFDVLTDNPTSHMRPLAFTATRTTTSLVTTSQVRFKMYDVDFGDGCPEFACLTPLFAGSYTMGAFLPPPPSLKGVNVLLTSNPDTMKSIREKEFWNDVFEVVW